MKENTLFILFILISLSEAAQPNLRFLRTIPNRNPRTPIIPTSQEDPEDNTINEFSKPPQKPSTVIPEIFDTVILKPIFIYFMSHDEEMDELKDIIHNCDDDNLEDAYTFCASINNFTKPNCKSFIDKFIIYLQSDNAN